ncbi:MAG TPA: alpha/beta hydrolase [Solirubrobacteraceae bacterium]|nr:alpha/beta hydrolase [Solirubrobacteraceae bacterium]
MLTAPSESAFTPSHRGGAGPPLLLIHGFTDTWRTWELVLPALERRREVLAVTLAGHAGGPRLPEPVSEGALPEPVSEGALLDALERALGEAGWESAHVAGNSLGGYLALKLAERGRARSVVALAPAGGWAGDDRTFREVAAFQTRLHAQAQMAAPYADAIMAKPSGRRAATQYTTVNFEHIPAELLAHQLRGVAACSGAVAFIDSALAGSWHVEPERIACPVRFVWGTEDRLLPWPSAAARYREQFPHAEWIELDGVGHCPQLDVPAEAAELILGLSGG